MPPATYKEKHFTMIHCTTKKTVLDGKPVLLDFGLDAFANLDIHNEAGKYQRSLCEDSEVRFQDLP